MPSLEIFPTLVAWDFPPSTARQSLGQDLWKVKKSEMVAQDLSEYRCNMKQHDMYIYLLSIKVHSYR